MPTSPYDDLGRPPLRAAALARALVVPGGLWQEVRVVAETASTNADVAAAARAGAEQGLVVVAESQTSGRGRLGRTWTAPPRSGLTFSVLLRPAGVPAERWGWLPLLAGVAVASAVRRVAEVDARLKWPNDVVVGERKLAGILAERVDTDAGPAAVVGVGLNVTLRADERPVAAATSLLLEGAASTDRDPLLRATLRELARCALRWMEAGGDATRAGLRADYVKVSASIGREVRVELPGGGVRHGVATAVDELGRLVVGGTPLSSGDVVHVRAPGSGDGIV